MLNMPAKLMLEANSNDDAGQVSEPVASGSLAQMVEAFAVIHMATRQTRRADRLRSRRCPADVELQLAKADEELGVKGELIANYDRALETEISAQIMVLG